MSGYNRRQRAVVEAFESRLLLTASPPVVDLLVLYTPGAAAAHGGAAHIQSLIQQVVDSTNAALQRSMVALTIRLVHVEQIAYVGSGDVGLDRQRLQIPNDGFLDTAQALRNTWGADLVHLVTSNAPNGGGNACLLDDLNRPDLSDQCWSAMDETSLQPSNLTLAHELGHTLGAGHERGNPTQPAVGPFPYSYGYQFFASGVHYHDIMSYAYPNIWDPDIGIPYFANPAVSFNGVPTGVPAGQANEADLALTFLQTGPVVAAYRSTVVSDTAAPVATVYERNPSGLSLTFTIQYRDDSAVDVSSIGDNDVYVLTPEGFQLAAEFLGVTGGPSGNGWQKLAKYRVTLPASNPPIASLQFVLRANQVKDVNGNFAPAATLGSTPGDNAGWDLTFTRDLGSFGAANATSILTDSVDDDDTDDIYKFNLTAPATLNVGLSGMTDDANVYVLRDANGNGIYDGTGDFIKGTFNQNSSGDRAFSVNLTVLGPYFVWVYRQNPGGATNYTMRVDVYHDTTPPTAKLDATDVKTAGAPSANFAIDYADDRFVDGETTRYWAALDIHAHLDNGGDFTFFYYPDPNLNVAFPQNAPAFRTFYSILAFNSGTGWTANDNGLYTISVHQNTGTDPRMHDAAGNDLPLTTLGSFRIAIGSPDSTAPTVAQLGASPILVPGATTYDFTVDYRDNVAIDGLTLGNGDVRVTGPGGFNQLASFISVSPALPPTIGSRRVATYRINAPAGGWQYTNDGSYTISIEPNQVRDTSNNPLASGSLGTLIVHTPIPGDANGDDRVNVNDFSILATNFGRFGRGVPQGDFNFDGIVNVSDFAILASKFGTTLPAGAAGKLTFGESRITDQLWRELQEFLA